MQQFVVPQFITVEDKILGPLTVRQFLIILGVSLILFITYKLSDFALFIILAIPIIILGGILAFVKVNGKPFHFFLLNFMSTIKKTRVRIWSSRYKEVYHLDYDQKEKVEEIKTARAYNENEVVELSKTVDTAGKYRR